MKIRLFLFISFLLLSLCHCSSADSSGLQNQNLETRTVTVQTSTGSKTISAEIADTPQKQSDGLMNRNSLAPDAGMLFLFQKDKQNGFWMKDTFISLDILFINAQKQILYIAENTTVLSETPIIPSTPYRFVLEVNAGYCQKHGIHVGDTIQF